MKTEKEKKELSLQELIEITKQQVLNRPKSEPKPEYPYIAYDLYGYPYNAKYPPENNDTTADEHGYKTDAQDTFFHFFAVWGYDVSFKYKGKPYYLLYEWDHAAVCDEHFTKEYQVYSDPNTLMEKFTIDGRPLIELIDELEEVEPV